MTGLTVSGVDVLRDPSREEKKMSITTARWGVLAAVIALSGCSGGKPAGQFASNESGATDAIHGSNAHGTAAMAMPSTGDPDTDFLRGMIPHHEGAVDMARAELANGTDPKMRAMAEEVIRTQQAEIVKMKTWLAERQAAKKGTR
ncbi:CopM family metallochaperone [Sphingomonas spermidinifaciens]|nr:DUF305 domain-containing protein [Sphingomonas spermidinifaciens]